METAETSAERTPCLHCGEPVLQHARLCPHCRQSLLVGLAVTPPLPAREAYAAARELAALDPAIPFLPARRGLEAGTVVASDLDRRLAARAAAVLARYDRAAQVRPPSAYRRAPPAPARAASPWRAVAIGALAGAALAAGWVLSTRPFADPPAVPLGEPRAAGAAATARPEAAGLVPGEIALRAGRSTAALRCGGSQGSGFFVATDRLVTNAHVLCGQDEPLQVLLADGRELEGRPERSDEWLDIAVVYVAGAASPALPLGDAAALEQGDTVYFYGSPRGLDFTLSRAIVSHKSRARQGVAYVQVDGHVNPGNSGGPLLDDRGRVVGIVSMMVGEASGLGLALPVNYLYEGDGALLAAPAGSDRAAWQRLVRQATAADERDAARTREQLRRPALAGAYLVRGPRVVALVILQAHETPLPTRLDFRLERNGQPLCYPSGTAQRWSPAGSLDQTDLDPRTARWLERHRLDATIWAAPVALDWVGCPDPGSTLGDPLVLSDGMAAADRAEITFSPLPAASQ